LLFSPCPFLFPEKSLFSLTMLIPCWASNSIPSNFLQGFLVSISFFWVPV
jgi:hypothetical protein